MAFIKDTLDKIILGRWRFLNLRPLVSGNIQSLAIDENGNLGIGSGESEPIYWDDIENKPTSFPPAAHNHNASQINAGVLTDARIPSLAISKITGLQTELNNKADTTDLGDLAIKDTIAVPTDITATGTASATTYLRGDGSWTTPTNTTYSVITEAEFNTGTASTTRAVSAVSLNRDIQKKINDLIPTPPVSGTFVLTSTDGVISWVEQV